MKLCRDNFARAPLRRFRILGGEQEVFMIRSGWSRDAYGMQDFGMQGLYCRKIGTLQMLSDDETHASASVQISDKLFLCPIGPLI